MAGKVIQLLTCVCFLKMITMGKSCTVAYWSHMSMEEHLYHADIVVLAYVTYIPAGEYVFGDGLFKVLCVFKHDGYGYVQADIRIKDIKRVAAPMCNGEYGDVRIGTTWIVALRSTGYMYWSVQYSWHEVEPWNTAAWNNTHENIQKVASVCGLQNWAPPSGVNMKNSDCPNMRIPATCINGGKINGCDWRMVRQYLGCEWARNQWKDLEEFRFGSPCPTKEVQTMDCSCDQEPWTDWVRSSLDPCVETRSRGEIRTISPCQWERLGTPTEHSIFNCIKTRACESLIKLPCNDIAGVQAVVDLCVTAITTNQTRNVKQWEEICKDKPDAIKSGKKCLRQYTHCTDGEVEALLSTGPHCFYIMMCDEGALNPGTKTMLDDDRFDQDVIDAIDFSPCLDLLNEPNAEIRNRMYVPTLSCMQHVIEQARLTEPNNELARLMAQFMIDCTALIDDLGPISEFYDFRSPRCNMRIWGEPHIETCNDAVTQTTCAAPGLQTYLDLYFLKITGVNTNPDKGLTRVTMLTEVTIEFKSLTDPSIITARYKAKNTNLPTTLEVLKDPVSEIDRVSLTMEPFESHFMDQLPFVPVLVWNHTGIEISLNTWGSFLQFTMRAPQAVMNTGTGILIQGCPRDQVLILWSVLRINRRRRNSDVMRKRDEDERIARAACLALDIPPNAGDMEACMFDVVMTHDTTMAGATSTALADRDKLVNRDEERIQNAGVWSLDVPSGVQYCMVAADVMGCRNCVPNAFLLDPTNCSRYYQCLGYGRALRRTCFPQILHFNLASGQCDWRWNARCQLVSADAQKVRS